MIADSYASYRGLPRASGDTPGLPTGRTARERLQEVLRGERAGQALAELLPFLLAALDGCASPERALTSLTRWLNDAADQPRLLAQLARDPRALEMVITLFAGSQFLTGIFMRNPSYLELLLERDRLAHTRTRAQFLSDARSAVDLRRLSGATALDALRRYQQRAYLMIGMADLCGLLDLASVTAQLSYLAESVVRLCLDTVAVQTGVDPQDFVVLALGKLGGVELNYSSDIDLLFLAARDAAGYDRLGQALIKALTQVTGEGFLYRVDMRLRPWGRVGPLVPTLDGYRAYLTQNARLWEKQSLLKARPIAGNEQAGREILTWAAAQPFDRSQDGVRADIMAMKQMTEDELHRQGRDWGEVKLGKGSIRDVEFVTQYLQLVHVARYPELRSGNTVEALARLVERGLLPPDEQRVLLEGYVFLRTVEHYLQMLDYRQTNTLPNVPAELAYLAQRLGFHGAEATTNFIARYQQHTVAIRAIYQQYLGAIAMEPTVNAAAAEPDGEVRQHLSRMAPAYSATFSSAEVRRHAAMVERLSPTEPVRVEAEALDVRVWRVTVVGYDYPGELSLICGLLFVHGCSIVDGHVYTYEPPAGTPSPAAEHARPPAETRPKIVDVFTVRLVRDDAVPDLWVRYAADLAALLRLFQGGQRREAQGKLATDVALALRDLPASGLTLHPIELEIDNQSSDRYTILRIRTLDTLGFLYEFTNALALTGIYIGQVSVSSTGSQVFDILYVTDREGAKITAPEKLRELRATTVLIKHFTHLLPQTPNPQAALLHFHAYLNELLRRPTWPDELASLERPEVLQALARLLGVSDFLWEDFLRMQYASLFPVMRDPQALVTAKDQPQLRAELAQALAVAPDAATRRSELNAFKDREMFRTDMRYIMGHLQGSDKFGQELTDLAEVVLSTTLEVVDDELRARFGVPRLEDGHPSTVSLLALGKCGGRELGFASDIELMFVYAGNGLTGGPSTLTSAEYYEKLVPAFVQAIRARRAGIFEIDLQLRPYGSAGSLAVSLSSFQRYFAPGGAAWDYERQALIKLRPIGGDPALGQQVADLRDRFVYSGQPFNITAMRAMRERQLRHLVTPGSFNAKFSMGGLVDVEYLVQGLQIDHGHDHPALRTNNTAEAMAALAEAGFLAPEDYVFLRQAHAFLWRLIEALRMVRGNAKDLTVPATDDSEFAFLARRLGYGADSARLQADLSTYTAGTRRLTARL